MILNLLRKEKIATSKDLADFLVTGGSSLSGISVTPSTALRFGPVFACIRVLAESIGQLPFFLYHQRENIKTKATKHRLYNLLYFAPNEFMTSQEWREMLVVHLCLRGNFYCYVNRYDNQVRELLPLNPDAVQPNLDDSYELTYKVTFKDGTADVLSSNEVLHIRLMSLDGVTGLSPIQQARESIGLGMATERYGSLLFKNGARPGGVLSTEGKLNKEQVEMIRQQWESTHGGENAHRAAILQGGLSWTSISMAAEDAQFLETRKFQRSEIAGIFRVPPHAIGDLDRATFSNIEHQALEYVTYSLMPLVTRIEQRINVTLLSPRERFNYYAKLNVAGLLRGDMKTRSEFYSKQLQNGALSPNEIRDLEDMNPREGGDEFYTPMNMTTGKEQENETEKPEDGTNPEGKEHA